MNCRRKSWHINCLMKINNFHTGTEKEDAQNVARLFVNGYFQPTGLFEKQLSAIQTLQNGKTRYLLYGGGAGGGKTWLGWNHLLFSCIAYPGIRTFVGRNELKRLRQTTFRTFFKVCRRFKIMPSDFFRVNNNENIVVFHNGSQIDLLDLRYIPSDPLYERFGSYEFTFGWLEEAGEINFGAFDVLKSRIGRQFNDKYNIFPHLFITCNPKKNWLKRMFYDRHLKGNLPSEYAFIRSLATDNPRLDSEYINNLRQLKDVSLKERLLNGSWEYEDNPMRLITDEAILNMWGNKWVDQSERYVTADVARHGSDLFVICIWNGWRLVYVEVIEKCGLHEAWKVIEDLREKYKISQYNTLIDEEGVGGGLVDFGGYRGFVSNSKAIDEGIKESNYQNLGVQCGYRFADRMNKNQIWIDCRNLKEDYKDMLIQDLEAQERMPRNENEKLKLLKKQDVKEKLGRSPDFWDAIRMRYWFELDNSIIWTDEEDPEGTFTYNEV